MGKKFESFARQAGEEARLTVMTGGGTGTDLVNHGAEKSLEVLEIVVDKLGILLMETIGELGKITQARVQQLDGACNQRIRQVSLELERHFAQLKFGLALLILLTGILIGALFTRYLPR